MLDSAGLVPQAWNLMRKMTSTIMMVGRRSIVIHIISYNLKEPCAAFMVTADMRQALISPWCESIGLSDTDNTGQNGNCHFENAYVSLLNLQRSTRDLMHCADRVFSLHLLPKHVPLSLLFSQSKSLVPSINPF